MSDTAVLDQQAPIDPYEADIDAFERKAAPPFPGRLRSSANEDVPLEFQQRFGKGPKQWVFTVVPLTFQTKGPIPEYLAPTNNIDSKYYTAFAAFRKVLGNHIKKVSDIAAYAGEEDGTILMWQRQWVKVGRTEVQMTLPISVPTPEQVAAEIEAYKARAAKQTQPSPSAPAAVETDDGDVLTLIGEGVTAAEFKKAFAQSPFKADSRLTTDVIGPGNKFLTRMVAEGRLTEEGGVYRRAE